MRMNFLLLAGALALGGCADAGGRPESAPAPPPVRVKLIAINDFHGNLEMPRLTIDHPEAGPGASRVPAGGAAYLASAVAALRRETPNSLVVSAGDMIGGSPLSSALFLDEPTIHAMNLIGLDFNAVGNHEFDRGRAELLRMQNGGCEKHTRREPCAVEPFSGARFAFLAASTVTANGETLLPAYAIRSFAKGAFEVKVGIIGLTLKDTPTLVTPAGVEGLTFRDEAETVNALVPRLKAEGADAIVVLIHQGIYPRRGYNDKSCEGFTGDLMPILNRLDPAVDVVVSGHTHRAYVCDYGRINPARPILLTSANRAGTMLTDIDLDIDPAAGRVVAKRADNIIVQSGPFTEGGAQVANVAALPRYDAEPRVAALVARYSAAAAPVAARPVGRFSGPARRKTNEAGEGVLPNLVADAQLAATRGPGGAQIALMNHTGLREDIIPAADGGVSFGQVFAVQPFGNQLVVRSFTGRQIKAVLEQQFASGSNSAERPNMLAVSHNMRFSYDVSRPAGQRVLAVTIDGQPLRDDQVYRVTMNSFLAGGGDHFTAFTEGTETVTGVQDLDALEAYIAGAGTLTPPGLGRIENRTPER
jgi:5'-nucleotidase